MRTIITVISILFCVLFLCACTGDSRSQSNKPVGGCSADTISLGSDIEPGCDDPLSPARISILSVQDAGEETYRAAASELISLLGELGVDICAVPQLVVIREGPCWPRYRIDIRLEKGSEKAFPEIKSVLTGGTIAGSSPSEERPEGYGLFFIQAGSGSTDRWTLWYDRPQD